MLGLFMRSPRKRGSSPVRRPRLRLEELEPRHCPSGLAITSLSAVALAGQQLQLTGTVSDADPASVRVSFGGVASGSATPDANGNFSYTGSASGLGTVSAWATDGQMMMSSTVSTQLTKAAPTLTLSVTYGARNSITLSGTVTDLDPGARTVSFTGALSASTTTDSGGNFSFTTTSAQLGTIQAFTTDVYGQPSPNAQVTVSCAAPVITNFIASQEPQGYWTFSGTVTAASPAGLTVTFGGLPNLSGQSVQVASDGSFSLYIKLPAGQDGTVTVQTTDWWGQMSNQASVVIADN